MPINRLVAFVLGPAITIASGYISLWLSRHFPGAHLPSQKTVAGVLTSGVITVVPMLLAHAKIQKWLDGWQSYEKRLNDATNGALDTNMSRFLEAIAAKTGVPLPTGEVPVEAPVTGSEISDVTGGPSASAEAWTGPDAPVEDPPPDVFSEAPPDPAPGAPTTTQG